jgi:hypothetical protein
MANKYSICFILIIILSTVHISNEKSSFLKSSASFSTGFAQEKVLQELLPDGKTNYNYIFSNC